MRLRNRDCTAQYMTTEPFSRRTCIHLHINKMCRLAALPDTQLTRSPKDEALLRSVVIIVASYQYLGHIVRFFFCPPNLVRPGTMIQNSGGNAAGHAS